MRAVNAVLFSGVGSWISKDKPVGIHCSSSLRELRENVPLFTQCSKSGSGRIFLEGSRMSILEFIDQEANRRCSILPHNDFKCNHLKYGNHS